MKINLEELSNEELLEHFDALAKVISKLHSEKIALDITAMMMRSELEEVLDSSKEKGNEDI